jgi:hypothetical protein
MGLSNDFSFQRIPFTYGQYTHIPTLQRVPHYGVLLVSQVGKGHVHLLLLGQSRMVSDFTVAALVLVQVQRVQHAEHHNGLQQTKTT